MLIVISKHYTAARQIWVRRGKKKKKDFCSAKKLFCEQFPDASAAPQNACLLAGYQPFG